jgi:hypothetical protein
MELTILCKLVYASEPLLPELSFFDVKFAVGKLVMYKVKLSLCLTNQAPHHEVIQRGGTIALLFLILAPDGGAWSASHPGLFTSRKKSPRCPLYRRLSGPGKRKIYCFCQELSSL